MHDIPFIDFDYCTTYNDSLVAKITFYSSYDLSFLITNLEISELVYVLLNLLDL